MKQVLMTGASGFLGHYFLDVYSKMDSKVFKIGRDQSNDLVCDLSSESPEIPIKIYDQVIYAAGKAHFLPKTEAEKKEFFDVNVTGLKNFLESIEKSEIAQFVLISTVAVYGCDSGVKLDENTALLATDPYGRSKIEAEKIAIQWCKNRNIPILVLRLPLVAGSNPSGNLKAMADGLRKNRYFRIGNGNNRKSVVLAEDVAVFCSKLSSKAEGIYHLTDDDDPTFSEIDGHLAQQLKVKRIHSLPFWTVKILAKIGDFFGKKAPINSNRLMKMTSTLTFSCEKAKRELNWNPRKTIEINYL